METAEHDAVSEILDSLGIIYKLWDIEERSVPGASGFQDVGSMFSVVTGVNFRLGKDVVGCIGVHYGKLIEIPYSGGAMDILAKHRMTSVMAALKGSAYEHRTLESLAV